VEHECILCEARFEAWLPSPRREAESPVLRALQVAGSGIDEVLCPQCGSDGRERHAWMYLAASGVLDDTVGKRALHAGPEPRLRQRLAQLPCDWTFREPGELAALLAAPGEPFHLIVANRLLEQVEDLGASLAALAARLAPGGWLVAQCRHSPLLERTLAFTGRPEPRAAFLFLGEEGHRRLPGMDLASDFAAAGLRGGPYAHADVLPAIDAAQWGVDAREPFFLFSRDRCLASPS